MFKDSVCYTQITFGIFKINRIHLMRLARTMEDETAREAVLKELEEVL